MIINKLNHFCFKTFFYGIKSFRFEFFVMNSSIHNQNTEKYALNKTYYQAENDDFLFFNA